MTEHDGLPDNAATQAKVTPRWREGVLVFLLGAALMAWAYGGWRRGDAAVPGNDSFYHVKMASIMPAAARLREFPWLRYCYFTDSDGSFVSHHYGFHLLLAPFVKISHGLTGSYLPGGRWGMCVFFGLLVVALHYLAAYGLGAWRWLWLPLFVLLPFQFFTRHEFVRAITPSLAFMLLIALLLFKRKYAWMAVCMIGFVHLYMGGVLFGPVIVIAYVAGMLVCERSWSAAWKTIAWSLAAWIAAIVIHPYRGGMWEFLQLQVFGSGLSPDIAVGKEWRPYNDVWWFVTMCGPLLGAWATAVAVRLYVGERIRSDEFALFLLNIAFFVLTAKARRFIEYWPVFGLLSALFLAAPGLVQLQEAAKRRGYVRALNSITRWGAVLSIAGTALVAAFSPQWRGIQRDAACDFDLPAIEAALGFIRENSQAGEVIFTDDWDVFPIFFYYNSHNHYIVGLDPKFTHHRRPDLWARYVKITRGQTPAVEQVRMPDGKQTELTIRLEDIRDHFHARWVVADRDHRALSDDLAEAKDFAELVYPAVSYAEARNAPYVVFRVR